MEPLISEVIICRADGTQCIILGTEVGKEALDEDEDRRLADNAEEVLAVG